MKGGPTLLGRGKIGSLADKRTRSKWCRVMRCAVAYKRDADRAGRPDGSMRAPKRARGPHCEIT